MLGTLSLTVSSPAQSIVEPITLAEAKAYLGVPERSPADYYENELIETLISAARDIAETHQKRDLAVKQYDLALDGFPVREIELRPHLVSVDLVRYRNSDGAYTTLVTDTDYIADTAKQPGLVMPAYGKSWPSFTRYPSSAVLIRFTAGVGPADPWWDDCGKRVKAGMLMLISMWFSNRLPFGDQNAEVEYPYAVTACLSYGGVPRAY